MMAAEQKKEDLSLAESRPRRARAGRNIGKLIDQEQDGDDFYKTAYGGFEEESADEAYEEEASEDDEVDSDFDVDESTWNQEEDGEQQLQLMEQKKKKKQWLKPTKPKSAPQVRISEPSSPKPPKAKKPRTTVVQMSTTTTTEQRSLRKSTLEVSEEFRRRMQEEEEVRKYQRSRKSAARKKPLRKLTQKEMLEEAKKTERENLASLEAYTLLEAEKRRVKEKKTGIQGPFVRFHSVTMPAITELPDSTTSDGRRLDPQSSQVTDNSSSTSDGAPSSATQNQTAISLESSVQPTATGAESQQQRYCRNFLVFTDTVNFPSAFFPTTKPQKPRRKFCPVTGLPARYVDPITGTPYATSQAFRIIRNKYISEGEQKCEKRLLQLSNWLEEKKRKKMETKAY